MDSKLGRMPEYSLRQAFAYEFKHPLEIRSWNITKPDSSGPLRLNTQWDIHNCLFTCRVLSGNCQELIQLSYAASLAMARCLNFAINSRFHFNLLFPVQFRI